MNELVQTARDLLGSGKVAYIIGYEKNFKGVTKPFIARSSEAADRLVFNHYALNNLAVYLHQLKKETEGKIGIVAKGCDIKAIVALIQENQIKRDDIFIIGMNCSGVVRDPSEEWNQSNTQIKCGYCQLKTPKNADIVIGESEQFAPAEDDQLPLIKKIEAMSSQERLSYFSDLFSDCIKCYACRQVCPLCYCEECVADKTMPRWVDSSASERGNFSWNIIRAFHQGGRCIGCHECERACPMDIPISLLTRKIGQFVREEFNYVSGLNPDEPTFIGSYNSSDKADFIK